MKFKFIKSKYTYYKKKNFIFKKYFLNLFIFNFLPDFHAQDKFLILKNILPLIIKKKIIDITFTNRRAEAVDNIPSNYLKIIGKKYYEVSYHLDTRKCHVARSNELVNISNILCDSDTTLKLGIALFDEEINTIIKKDSNCEVLILINIYKNKNKDSIKQIKCSIPVASSRHGYFGIVKNENFYDFELSLKDFDGQSIRLSIECQLNKGSFLIYNNNDLKPNFYKTKPFIALNPILLNKSSDSKKIILLSFESMTDPYWLKEKFSFDTQMPALDKLKNDGYYFSNAYSQADSTRPFTASLLYGLFPSQHSFGDYRPYTEYKKFFPQSLTSIPKLLEGKSFYSSANLPYNHFDSKFGFASGFDSYVCNARPELNTVTDMSWVIRSIDSMLSFNHFIFSHIQYLHPPFLINNSSKLPRNYNLDSLSESHKNNHLPLYNDQLSVVDSQLSLLVAYLKEQKIYDQTMIILLGDHGVGIPPWWKKTNNEYAHYNMRSRIPLLFKPAKWSKASFTENLEKPVNATLLPFIKILESLDCKKPVYWDNLYQSCMKNNKYSIIETIFHPKYNNYAISLLGEEYKYWMNTLVDWDQNQIKEILAQKLFRYDKTNNEYNENIDLINNLEQKNTINEFEKFAQDFFKLNRTFYNNYINKKI